MLLWNDFIGATWWPIQSLLIPELLHQCRRGPRPSLCSTLERAHARIGISSPPWSDKWRPSWMAGLSCWCLCKQPLIQFHASCTSVGSYQSKDSIETPAYSACLLRSTCRLALIWHLKHRAWAWSLTVLQNDATHVSRSFQVYSKIQALNLAAQSDGFVIASLILEKSVAKKVLVNCPQNTSLYQYKKIYWLRSMHFVFLNNTTICILFWYTYFWQCTYGCLFKIFWYKYLPQFWYAHI